MLKDNFEDDVDNCNYQQLHWQSSALLSINRDDTDIELEESFKVNGASINTLNKEINKHKLKYKKEREENEKGQVAHSTQRIAENKRRRKLMSQRRIRGRQ